MAKHRKLAVKGKVYINREYEPRLIPVLVESSRGPIRVDHAKVKYDLGRHSQQKDRHKESHNIIDHVVIDSRETAGTDSPDAFMGAECEITISSAGSIEKVIHAGEINLKEIGIEGNTDGGESGEEVLYLVSRHTPFLFGKPIDFQHVPPVNREEYIDDFVIFNPSVDDKTIGNRYTPAGSNPDNESEPKFIPPGSQWTNDARKVHRHELYTNTLWRLSDAVMYCLTECNLNENFFKNPTREELNEMLGEKAKEVLRSVKIPPGTHLPKALEILCKPYGVHVKIDYRGKGTYNRVISFYHQGHFHDNVKQLWLQKPGEDYRIGYSSARELHIDGDISQVVNRAHVTGSKIKLEVTAELVPGWKDENQASLMASENQERTFISSQEWAANPKWHRVFRHWVWNEGGDHGGDIPDLTKFFQANYKNHPKVFTRRRKFLPTITLDGQDDDRQKPYGRVDGCHLEYIDPYDNETWLPMPAGKGWWDCKVLEDQCGVYFTAEIPPMDLVERLLANAGKSGVKYLRITGTVESDSRIFAVNSNTAGDSAARKLHEIHVNRPTSFHRRKRATVGEFKSELVGIGQPDETDDQADIDEYAKKAREEFDHGLVHGRANIESLMPVDNNGAQLDYEVGDIITAVEGRKIIMASTTHTGQSDSRYATIVGVRYQFQSQQEIVLTFETFRAEETQVATARQK